MPLRDVLDITVHGGHGGHGAMSFLRLKYIAKGGPDGGRGGDGGSVYLQAVDDVTALERLASKRQYKAGTGGHGEGRNRAGSQGEDVILEVPVGTVVHDLDSGEVVADLLQDGERVLIAQGGAGGRGNSSFATSKRQTPRFAEYGTPGETRKLRLELRTIADVGLVGYPNAGKSSLLAALSNAKPQIASYPFTTLSPNLGIVEDRSRRFTLADIPGIIEGASAGKGLGLEFLRHIARTRLLVFVLDIAEEPVKNLEALRRELSEYDPALLSGSALIALNKADLASPDEIKPEIEALTRFGLPVLAVSALERQGLDELKRALFELLPARPQLEPLAPKTKRVTLDPVRVERQPDGASWRVKGEELEALVSRFDPTNRDAVSYLQHHFSALGVPKLLRRAGAKDGDTVRIGEAEFEYFGEDKPVAASAEEGDEAKEAIEE